MKNRWKILVQPVINAKCGVQVWNWKQYVRKNNMNEKFRLFAIQLFRTAFISGEAMSWKIENCNGSFAVYERNENLGTYGGEFCILIVWLWEQIIWWKGTNVWGIPATTIFKEKYGFSGSQFIQLPREKKKNYLTPVSGVVLAQPVRWQAIECTPNVQSGQERNSPISTIQAFYWRTKSKSKAVTSLSWCRSGGIYTLKVPYDFYSSDMFFF